MNLTTLLRLSQKNGWNYTSTSPPLPLLPSRIKQEQIFLSLVLAEEQKKMQAMYYNVKLWRFPVTIAAVEKTMRAVCVAEIHDAVSYITTLFASFCHFLITRHLFFNIIFAFVFLFCIFSILCILCFVLFCALFLLFYVYSCPFPIFVKVYRLQPPGCNPTAVKNYHIIYHIISYRIVPYRIVWYRIVSYHIIYHIISYNIIPYHTITYHTIPYHITSYRTVSYRIISYPIISYHIP